MGLVYVEEDFRIQQLVPQAIDKKYWLFVGHPEAGERAAIIYSVLISCQRLDIDPQAYLFDVLKKNTSILGEEELSALRPKNWKKARES